MLDPCELSVSCRSPGPEVGLTITPGPGNVSGVATSGKRSAMCLVQRSNGVLSYTRRGCQSSIEPTYEGRQMTRLKTTLGPASDIDTT